MTYDGAGVGISTCIKRPKYTPLSQSVGIVRSMVWSQLHQRAVSWWAIRNAKIQRQADAVALTWFRFENLHTQYRAQMRAQKLKLLTDFGSSDFLSWTVEMETCNLLPKSHELVVAWSALAWTGEK